MDTTPVDSRAVLDELERLLTSDTFRSAGRSSRLLRFLVEETLKGNAERLKDYTLGSEALGRGDDFDPRTDPIARVEASRLRSRLELYYATEGASNPVRITLPKGGYVPRFETRPVRPPAELTTKYSPRRQGVLWAILTLVTMIAAAEGFWLWRTLSPRAPEKQKQWVVATPPTTDPLALDVSPDGQQMVFVAGAGEGRSRLWVHSFETNSTRPLLGTDSAAAPFWSADSRSIGFFAGGLLKRIDVDTGTVMDLTRAIVAAGGDWNRSGEIIFPIVPDTPLFKVSAKGGEAAPLTTREPLQTGHRAPHFLPDDRHFLFYAMGATPEVRGVYVGNLDGGKHRRLFDADAPAVYSAGHLLYVHQNNLFARKFDPVRLSLEGDPFRVADGVAFGGSAGIAALSATADGMIVYRKGSSGRRQLVLFDRSGNELGKVGGAEGFGPSYLAASPDFTRWATQRTIRNDTDIYVLDRQGRATRITTDPGPEISPIWTLKSDSLIFSGPGRSTFDLFRQTLDGSEKELLLETAQPKQASHLSADESLLLFRSLDERGTGWDIWALPLETGGDPIPVVKTKFEERDAQFSPDNRWIAYQSDETGRFEIYLQAFPAGRKIRVTSNGGVDVRWHTRNELFYIAPDGWIVSVALTYSTDGEPLVGAHTRLFFSRITSTNNYFKGYAISPDGQRFLVDTAVEEPAAPVTVILNWRGK